MNHDDLTLTNIKKEWHGSYSHYVIGFFGSLILTALSFSLVIFKVLSGAALIYVIVALALAQGIVQLIFFLHIGQEPKPKWEMIIFYFMVLVLLIIVIGSLWIMHDLNDRVMQTMHMEVP